jgi:ATP-dependent DNA helicase RecG
LSTDKSGEYMGSLIAAFFRNIWMADELGSGVRNLYRYGKIYSGKNPQLIDGDVFRIIVPLDDNYSFDALIGKPQTADLSRKKLRVILWDKLHHK